MARNCVRKLLSLSKRRFEVIGVVFILTALGMGGFVPTVAAQKEAAAQMPPDENIIDNDTCLMCHGDPAEPSYIDEKRFSTSIHGRHLCTSCHNDIKEVPHDLPLKPVSCASCHRIETQVYLNSEHGITLKKGNTEAATCRACHGEAHSLLDSRDPASPVYRHNIPRTCARCHSNSAEMAKYGFTQEQPVVSYKKSVHGIALYEKNINAAAVCTDCHGSHDLHRSTNPASKLNWRNIPTTCGKCHENIQATYRRSIHGQALAENKRDAPVCTDCHGEHTIEAVEKVTAKVHTSHIPETCGQCHGVERIITKYRLPAHVIETYMDSFHGLAVQLGSLTAANCASCHGFHDILPADDPRSSIHPDNLAQTCGKCHAGVGKLVTRGQIHSGTRPGLENRLTQFVRRFYIILIITVLTFMLLHNALDFIKKLHLHHREMAWQQQRERMGRNERIQHGILAFAFILLAYTGFALKYPQSWWASPFMGHGEWRSQGHRFGALVFTVLAFYHGYFIAFTRRGRKHLQALCFTKDDGRQFIGTLRYYLGRAKEKPAFGFYSYIEKIEYWALVWGSTIMIITGALMLNETWFLKHMPKWLFDVTRAIHFYEAILACLAILIWHGYFVMFDPDEYPMKMTWLTGHPSRTDEERQDESL